MDPATAEEMSGTVSVVGRRTFPKSPRRDGLTKKIAWRTPVAPASASSQFSGRSTTLHGETTGHSFHSKFVVVFHSNHSWKSPGCALFRKRVEGLRDLGHVPRPGGGGAQWPDDEHALPGPPPFWLVLLSFPAIARIITVSHWVDTELTTQDASNTRCFYA